MDVQAEKLKLEAWKVYTGLGLGADKEGWWLDDEKVSYPALETARRLKIKNICTHKGLALGLFNEAHCHPKDLVKVSKDFSDMNFLVYHSGFKALEAALPAAEDGFKKNPYVQRVPADYIDRLKQLYKQAGGPMPSNIIRNMDG